MSSFDLKIGHKMDSFDTKKGKKLTRFDTNRVVNGFALHKSGLFIVLYSTGTFFLNKGIHFHCNPMPVFFKTYS
jgi:hypothetical protein